MTVRPEKSCSTAPSPGPALGTQRVRHGDALDLLDTLTVKDAASPREIWSGYSSGPEVPWNRCGHAGQAPAAVLLLQTLAT